MKTNKTYAVFGLGRYGRAVAEELVKNGADVIAVDINEECVNDAAELIPVCKCADVTEAEVIERLAIGDVDVVVVAMANSLEATVMAITLCKEAGVPMVIAKCVEEMHGKIFSKVGADKVVFPEREAGARLGKTLSSTGFVDIVELSSDASMVELQVKKEWVGKSLVELHLRKKYSINVVALVNGDEVITNIDPEMPLKSEMKLVVIADVNKLEKLK